MFAEILSELLKMLHTRRSDIGSSDFLECAVRNSGATCDGRPIPLCRLKLLENEIVDRLHGLKSKPKFGPNQAEHGPKAAVGFYQVKRTSPIDDKLWAARQTLAVNLQRAMARTFKDEPNRPLALEKRTGIGKSGINRLLRPKTKDDPYPTLATLVRLADGLKISVFELVVDAHDMRDIIGNKLPPDDDDDDPRELQQRRNRQPPNASLT